MWNSILYWSLNTNLNQSFGFIGMFSESEWANHNRRTSCRYCKHIPLRFPALLSAAVQASSPLGSQFVLAVLWTPLQRQRPRPRPRLRPRTTWKKRRRKRMSSIESLHLYSSSSASVVSRVEHCLRFSERSPLAYRGWKPSERRRWQKRRKQEEEEAHEGRALNIHSYTHTNVDILKNKHFPLHLGLSSTSKLYFKSLQLTFLQTPSRVTSFGVCKKKVQLNRWKYLLNNIHSIVDRQGFTNCSKCSMMLLPCR